MPVLVGFWKLLCAGPSLQGLYFGLLSITYFWPTASRSRQLDDSEKWQNPETVVKSLTDALNAAGLRAFTLDQIGHIPEWVNGWRWVAFLSFTCQINLATFFISLLYCTGNTLLDWQDGAWSWAAGLSRKQEGMGPWGGVVSYRRSEVGFARENPYWVKAAFA